MDHYALQHLQQIYLNKLLGGYYSCRSSLSRCTHKWVSIMRMPITCLECEHNLRRRSLRMIFPTSSYFNLLLAQICRMRTFLDTYASFNVLTDWMLNSEQYLSIKFHLTRSALQTASKQPTLPLFETYRSWTSCSGHAFLRGWVELCQHCRPSAS